MTDNLLLHMQQKVVSAIPPPLPRRSLRAMRLHHLLPSPVSMFRIDPFAGLRASHLAQTSIIRITTA